MHSYTFDYLKPHYKLGFEFLTMYDSAQQLLTIRTAADAAFAWMFDLPLTSTHVNQCFKDLRPGFILS
jgi:hypothetical protein